jgi:7,8-dihydro-6-hydroxymethylpterin-pyrophosphokinase
MICANGMQICIVNPHAHNRQSVIGMISELYPKCTIIVSNTTTGILNALHKTKGTVGVVGGDGTASFVGDMLVAT